MRHPHRPGLDKAIADFISIGKIEACAGAQNGCDIMG
jgi:hypothetical protein